jgi:tetratricopeptide (TPR) repeat protein
VETLTNLGTVLIDLKRYDEARDYLRRANELNPNYEYAYFRMAESWDRRGRVDEVVKVLRSFAKGRTPRISGFDNLYQKYAVELAKYEPEPEKKKAPEPAKQKPDEKTDEAK